MSDDAISIVLLIGGLCGCLYFAGKPIPFALCSVCLSAGLYELLPLSKGFGF